MRDAVGVDGDHRDRLLAGQRAEHRDDLCLRQAVADRASGLRPRRDRRRWRRSRIRRRTSNSGLPRSTGTTRNAPSAIARNTPSAVLARFSKTFMTRACRRGRFCPRCGRSLPARGRRRRAPGRGPRFAVLIATTTGASRPRRARPAAPAERRRHRAKKCRAPPHGAGRRAASGACGPFRSAPRREDRPACPSARRGRRP